MSAAAVDSDTGQGKSSNDILLTAVKVDFCKNRPTGALRLTVSINGEEHQVDISVNGVVEWSGNAHCSRSSTVKVRIDRSKRSLPFLHGQWKTLASVETTLSTVSLDVPDSKQRYGIAVKFTTSGYREESYPPEINQPAAEPTVTSVVGLAKGAVENKTIIAEKLGKIWSVVEVIESVGDALSDIHPAIKGAVLALGLLTKACESQKAYRDEAMELLEQFDPFISIESQKEKLRQRTETRRAVGAMLDVIRECSEYILEKTSPSMIGGLFKDEYNGKIAEMKKRFTRAKEAFDCSIHLEIFKAVADIEENTQFLILQQKLSVCEEAHFQSGKENMCLEDTRSDLRERIMDWINDSTGTQPNMFWLRGKAGSGKTTVANTVAQAAKDHNYLLSCFFLKRDSTELSTSRRVLPTLAYRFVQQHESYRASIFQFLHTDAQSASITTTADIETQFNGLLKKPLGQTVDPLRPHVIIIDALDECSSSKEQTDLAKCLLQFASLAPWIKIIVTSRDEPAIRKVLEASTCVQCNINEEKGADDDIRRYIASQAEDLELQLSTADVRELVRRAEGLFIWCSTLFKYLEKCYDPKEDLESFLHGEQEQESWSQLYRLYDRVLELAAETPKDKSFIRSVLAIVAITANNRPLSAKAIATFLHGHGSHSGRREEYVRHVVDRLHAVLYVDGSTHTAIRAYHASFYDFLQQKVERATEAGSDWETLEAVHSRMLHCCIDTLDIQLHFNMCKIERPVLNKDIPDLTKRISRVLSEELQYSSCFWFTHLSPSNLIVESDAAALVSKLLCSRKLLFWLESLSLQDSLTQSLLAFKECMSFFQGATDIVAAASDAHRFVASFFEAMVSVPHIYLSSLFWLPRNGQTCRNVRIASLEHLRLVGGERSDWDIVVWERYLDERFMSVAYRPDSQQIVSGGASGRIYLFDSRTGAKEGEFHGHSNVVNSLAYCPGGRLLASGSWDKTIRIWNIKIGEPSFGPLTGHTDRVTCVAFSPSGQRIASGSLDHTIRIWDVRTGDPVGEPLQGDTGEVWAVTFSPDGQCIASGGYDCNVHIWSADSYEEIQPPFRGHEDTICSIRYSPDSRTIISGARDGTVRMWDARTGLAVREPLRGHTDWVFCVACSYDGRLIVSGSKDHTVRVWSALSGAPIGEPLRGHGDRVWSVSCSPDGLFIASVGGGVVRVWDVPTDSGSRDQHRGHPSPADTVICSPDGHHIAAGSQDGLIRLWNAETGAPIGEPLRGHEDGITSIVYSPNGRFIASGSDDCTVRIWDVQTGQVRSDPLEGHFDAVTSVAYSRNGDYIASASKDHTVCVWDAETGNVIGEPLQIGNEVLSVAFSPNGGFLACGSKDGTILVWDVSSKVSIRLKMILRGHYDRVTSIAFSPNGRYITSGSYDETVWIWDAQTGTPVGSPLTGHTGSVSGVAISPDSYLIASCSDDRTVRLWDAHGGSQIGDPLQGHSDWVLSVAFFPDGRSLVSSGEDRRSFVYNVPAANPSVSETEAHWKLCCSCMDEDDGWVKDGEILLLWCPMPYRPAVRSCARMTISKYGIMSLRIDFETLLKYSGRAWVNILSDSDI